MLTASLFTFILSQINLTAFICSADIATLLLLCCHNSAVKMIFFATIITTVMTLAVSPQVLNVVL